MDDDMRAIRSRIASVLTGQEVNHDELPSFEVMTLGNTVFAVSDVQELEIVIRVVRSNGAKAPLGSGGAAHGHNTDGPVAQQ